MSLMFFPPARALIACAALCLIVTGGAAEPTDQPCYAWNARGIIKMVQDNGFTVSLNIDQEKNAKEFTGEAQTQGSMGEIKEGRLVGDNFTMKIRWKKGVTGIYRARVSEKGHLTGGTTYDESTPSSTASWKSSRALTCVRRFAK
jgi:hypothetical protein